MPPRNCQRTRACISVSLLIGRCTRKSRPSRSRAAMWACKSGYLGFSIFPSAAGSALNVDRVAALRAVTAALQRAFYAFNAQAHTIRKHVWHATRNLTHERQVAFVLRVLERISMKRDHPLGVMPALVAGIHVFLASVRQERRRWSGQARP